jgi:hypothetical protein
MFSVTAADRLRDALMASAGPGGGWPYYVDKSARIEPTCWALMALAASVSDPLEWSRVAAPHYQWLASAQRRDGLLTDAVDAPVNFTSNGLAACVLGRLAGAVDLARLLDAIVASKGVSVNESDGRQNNRLQGWPWMSDTFSWIEPTCMCVLALKQSGSNTAGAKARIDEAHELIANRMCESGGWNYGNASVVGQDLRPYVPTTALALIALQDRSQTAAVERSVAWLYDARLKEPSATALSLAAIALRLHGHPVDDVERRLTEDLDRAIRVGNLQALAMMLYALTADRHQASSLRIVGRG